ncbi:MAG TPA: 1,2-phenylacetyl-CoA epoxidase subunit PaaE [Acidothermaceae bacterium]
MAGRPQFHTVRVSAIDRLTTDAVAITFAVPDDLAGEYAFSPGQHVTVRCAAAGDDGRRTYSLCSVPGVVRIGVKQIPGGVFSTYALGGLRIGDDIEVMTPTGRFTTQVDGARPRHRAAIVAGSGITPVLSIAAATLRAEPASWFTLIYGNRSADAVMFLDELADLKDRFPDRLAVFHVLSREVRDSALLTGRLDRAKLDELLEVAVAPGTVDEWFVCGPAAMIDAARAALREHDVDDATVHVELFHLATATRSTDMQAAVADTLTEQQASASVTITLAGRSTTLAVPPGRDVLHEVMRVRPDVPYGCTNGMCGTCRAKVVEGRVEMDHCYALDQGELDAGFVLTCQAQPRSEVLVLDYDA